MIDLKQITVTIYTPHEDLTDDELRELNEVLESVNITYNLQPIVRAWVESRTTLLNADVTVRVED